MVKLHQIKVIIAVFTLYVSTANCETCTGNTTCNSTVEEKKVIDKPKPLPQPHNDTKVGAASSESRHVVQGLTSYSEFNAKGGFLPSPFLGIVGQEPPPRPREVVGYGEAIPVPLHGNHPGYMRHGLFPPQRGYSAKQSLSLDQDNHLQEDIQFSPPPHHFGNGEHLVSLQEQHHEITGHPDLPVQAEISVQPGPTIHPEVQSRPPVPHPHPELSGRHPALLGHPLKLPVYHHSDPYTYHHISESLPTHDFGPPPHHSQAPVIFPEDGSFGKEVYPGQLSYPLPHDIKPVEEEQHDDGPPSHIQANLGTLKGHVPTQDSILHKLGPWKGVLKLLATLVPLGLLVAALQPSVLIVNATDPPLRPIPMPGMLNKFRTVGEELVASGDGENCDKRQLCDALVSSASTPTSLQLAYVALATRLKGEQKRSLDEVMERVTGRNCNFYNCPSLLAPPTPPT